MTKHKSPEHLTVPGPDFSQKGLGNAHAASPDNMLSLSDIRVSGL